MGYIHNKTRFKNKLICTAIVRLRRKLRSHATAIVRLRSKLWSNVAAIVRLFHKLWRKVTAIVRLRRELRRQDNFSLGSRKPEPAGKFTQENTEAMRTNRGYTEGGRLRTIQEASSRGTLSDQRYRVSAKSQIIRRSASFCSRGVHAPMRFN